MSCDRSCCFHLLEKIIRVYMGNAILDCVIVRIALTTRVILDLDSGCYSLLTEGTLVPSITASDDERYQV